MKKVLIPILAALLASCGPQQPQQYELTGNILGLEEGMVYLQDRVNGLFVNIDSTKVENSSFVLNGSLHYPQMRYLSIEGIDFRFSLFLENSEISIQIDAHAPQRYFVKGSASHDIFHDFNLLLAKHEATVNEIQQEILEAEITGQQELALQLRQKYEDTQQATPSLVKDYVTRHSDKTVAAFIATRFLAHSMDGEDLTALVNVFEPSISQTLYVNHLRERAEKLVSVGVGKIAPDFSLPGVDGEPLALSDFRGKYVLVSFWASWCSYCRVGNPHLVSMYSKYRGPGFEILGVSLDRSREAWLKGIAEDDIEWPQISDLQGWQNAASTRYGVSSIPANVLVDPQGVIIARNIRGAELEQKLQELFRTPV